LASELNYNNKTPLNQARMSHLREIASPGPVLILTHDNPDPDALASGKALATLLKKVWNIPSHLVYSGTVARADNRSMLKHLTPEWEHHDTLKDLDMYSAVALVDTQPGAGNNRLPSTHPPQIVIDHHHPIRETISMVQYADIQPEVGATVTLLYKYLETADLDPDPILETAMFYGLKTDTHGLSRGVSPADEATYLKLLSNLDHKKLVQVEHAGLDRDHFRALHRGLRVARVFGQVIVARLGKLGWPDQGAEMADLLIRLEDARAVLCQGEHEGTLHLSIRTKMLEEDAGQLIQRVVVAPGRAGGHGSMAGGQVPLSDRSAEQAMNEVEERFLTAVEEDGDGESLL
jgi:nanoRNase/pAp phosphatase (c-di-AMP/oligoRNAs hydrolase)